MQKRLHYTLNIDYNGLKYTFRTTFAVVNTREVDEIGVVIKFNGSQIEGDKIEFSGNIDTFDLDKFTFKRVEVLRKSLEKLGEHYFIKLEFSDDVSETLWLEVVFEE